MKRQIPYPHPGEILTEEFLKPMNMSAYRLAKEIHVPLNTHRCHLGWQASRDS